MLAQDVITRFCALSRDVMDKVFKYEKAADCFCGNINLSHFRFEEEVIEFIEQTVREKINNKDDHYYKELN